MISALVLAAGQSTRMGSPKMLLPWGNKTVIEKIVTTLVEAGLSSIVVVTGGYSSEVKETLSQYSVNFIFNPDYAGGEMLSSVQVGLEGLTEKAEAVLIVLGDQPQIEAPVVKMIMEKYLSARDKVVVPSYQMHRGHPWLVEKSLWQEIINLRPPATLHDFLIGNQSKISYVNVSTPSILQDLDTPRDYQLQKP